MSLVPGAGTPLLRDCSTEGARYLPTANATAQGRYLPVDSILATMRFLAATRALPHGSQPRRRAERAAGRIIQARLEILHLCGGHPAGLAELCRRLLPGRVDPAVLAHLCTTVNTAGHQAVEVTDPPGR